MAEPLSFDSGPDPELGARLRSTLDGPEPDRFLARIRLAVAGTAPETTWDVLARWAPAGIVAAAAAAALFWVLLGSPAMPDPGAQLMASAPARMDLAPGQAEADVLVSSVLEGR